MKIIWKIILGLSIAGNLTFAFFAIHGHGGCRMRERERDIRHDKPAFFMDDSCRIQSIVDRMVKEFSLTDAQKQQILQINYSHMRDFSSMDAKYKNDCVGAREAHIQLMKKKVDEIKAVLNDQQKARFEEFINKRRGPHRGEKDEPGDHHSEGIE
jgi:Spy/CpxP family protein refolding chaperone